MTTQKIQLTHPEGKKTPTMDRAKYDMLRDACLVCLKKEPNTSFNTLVDAVDAHLKKTGQVLEGKLEWHLFWVSLDIEAGNEFMRNQDTLEWNLFWVTLDLEAKGEIIRNKTVSPMLYRLT